MTSSPKLTSNGVTALAGQGSVAPGCVLLNKEGSPPPREDAHLEKSTAPIHLRVVSPGARPQAVLHTGRGRSRVSRATGM